MLTRLSTPSPFPQIPARQTAPAAQRPAAQRQGFTSAQFEDGRQILNVLQNLEPDPNMPQGELESFYRTILEKYRDFTTIAEQLSRLYSNATANTSKSDFKTITKPLSQLSLNADYTANTRKVEAELKKSNIRLWLVFKAFQEEYPNNACRSSVDAKIDEAQRLSLDFKTVLDKHFPSTIP